MDDPEFFNKFFGLLYQILTQENYIKFKKDACQQLKFRTG